MDDTGENNYDFFCTYHGIVKQFQIVMHVAVYFSEALKSPDAVDARGLLIVFTLSTFLNVVIAFLNIGIIYLSVKSEVGIKSLVKSEIVILFTVSLIVLGSSVKELNRSRKKEISKFELIVLPFLVFSQLTICVPLMIRYYRCKKLTYYVQNSPAFRQTPESLHRPIEMKVLGGYETNKEGEKGELLEASSELQTHPGTLTEVSDVELCSNLSPCVSNYYNPDNSSFNDSSMMRESAANYPLQICQCGFEIKNLIIRPNDVENLGQSEGSNLLSGIELVVSPISRTEQDNRGGDASDVFLSANDQGGQNSKQGNSANSLSRTESIEENRILTNHLEISFQEETLYKLRESLRPMKRYNYFRRKFLKIWKKI